MKTMIETIKYEDLAVVNKDFLSEFHAKLPDFFRKGWFILGEQVSLFEKEFAQYLGVKHCVGVGNGLDALELCLDVFDFPPGSEVLVPSNAYIASILSIIRCGLKPVLVEPSLITYNLEPINLEPLINCKTVAIMAVHLYGKISDMVKIKEIASTHGLVLIEDCAQTHGSELYGVKAGAWGDISAFSFYPTKNLGALGDAGLVATNSEELANRIRTKRNYGSDKKYYNDILGRNSRLDELQALFLRIKLKYLDKINEHKRTLGNIYFSNLSDNVVLPKLEDGYYDTYHIFAIRTESREDLRAYLSRHNVITEIHYPIPPHIQKAYSSNWNEQFPISELIHKTILSLPISYATNEFEVYIVCELINKYFENG